MILFILFDLYLATCVIYKPAEITLIYNWMNCF